MKYEVTIQAVSQGHITVEAASLEEIKEIAAKGEFLHYDSIRKVFED